MTRTRTTEATLDELRARAAGGDREAAEQLFESLRVRLLAVAKRRVREGDAEDVTHEALRVIHARLGAAAGGVLPWSFAVLRNVIGNHYRRQAREARHQPWNEDAHSQAANDAAAGAAPGAGGGGSTGAGRGGFDGQLEARELQRHLEQAIDALAARHPRCALLFRHLLASAAEGGGERQVSRRAFERACAELPELSAGNYYVTLHRCRARLRRLLEAPAGKETR